ncbi:MAG: serine/threonine-protein kinase [bacterium]
MDDSSTVMMHQYALSDLMGSSETGKVYKAWDTTMERVVALRVIPQELSENKIFRSRLMPALRLLSHLGHQNIGVVFGASRVDHKLIVMSEFITGKPLTELITEKPLGVKPFLDLAIQITEGLNHAHLNRVMHGNLRPSNIFITEDNNIKLVDFGLSLHSIKNDSSDLETSLRKAAYQSPEHITGEEITPLCDLFSLGSIFWELLTGKQLFVGDSVRAVEDAVLKFQPDFKMLQKEYFLEGDIILLLKKLLAKEPPDRFQSTNELLITLKAMRTFEVEDRTREFFQVKPQTPRQYMMLSILAALMIIFWLVITTVQK